MIIIVVLLSIFSFLIMYTFIVRANYYLLFSDSTMKICFIYCTHPINADFSISLRNICNHMHTHTNTARYRHVCVYIYI